MGADSRGFTLAQVEFAQPTQAEQIRAAVPAGGHDWEVTRFGTGNSFLIRMGEFHETPGNTAQGLVRQALSSHFQPTQYRVVRVEHVGAGRG